MSQTMLKTKIFSMLCNDNGFVVELLKNDFGFKKEKIEGHLFSKIFDPGSQSKALDFFIKIKEERYVQGYELVVVTPEGLKVLQFTGAVLDEEVLIFGAEFDRGPDNWVEQLFNLSNEQANQIRQLIKERNLQKSIPDKGDINEIFYEISKLNNELINLHRQLEKKNAELIQLNDLKNKFLGMAAHDLRNPLSIISSYASFLIFDAGNNLTEQQIKFLKIIEKSSRFMVNLLEDMLDFSKIESGKIEIIPEKIDLVEFIRQNVELNQVLSSGKKINLKFESSLKKIEIQADSRKLTQVLNNLIGNAVKFSFENSVVEIECRKKGDFIHISVADHGKGISPENMKLLFQPFQTLGAKGTSGEKGTGLGLYIVKKIVEAHHGYMEVKSEEGKGSVFGFYLPLSNKFSQN